MTTIKFAFVLFCAVITGSVTANMANIAWAFNEKNNNFVSNTHNHLRIGDFEGGPEEIQSSSGGVYNDENTHSNDNYNSERGENGNGYTRENTHSKPDNNNNN